MRSSNLAELYDYLGMINHARLYLPAEWNVSFAARIHLFEQFAANAREQRPPGLP
jgi:hypothetical protein